MSNGLCIAAKPRVTARISNYTYLVILPRSLRMLRTLQEVDDLQLSEPISHGEGG